MYSIIKTQSLTLVILICVAVVPRIPFLSMGFGLDPDAYRNISVAQRLSMGEGYSTSRFPGYPVHEFLLFLTYAYKTPFTANLISLVCFALTVICLFCIFTRIERRTAFPYALVFAAMPLTISPSVEAMDYALSLFLLTLALFFLVSGKRDTSAIALGVATASRISSGGAILAFLPFFLQGEGKRRILDLLRYGGIFTLSAVVFFSPVLLRYQMSFFTFYDNAEVLSLYSIFHRGMLGAWGDLGTVAAGFLVLLIAAQAIRMDYLRKSPFFQTGAVLVAIYWIAFFRLPHEAEYLLPAVVGFLLMASVAVRNVTTAWGFMVMVAIPSVLDIDFRAKSVAPGQIFSYYDEREERIGLIDCIGDRIISLPDNAIIVVPTSMEHGYFRQVAMRYRPDIRVSAPHMKISQNHTENVFKLTASLFNATGPGCDVGIVAL